MFSTIETARLILRPLREEDRSEMVGLHTDARMTRFESDPPDAVRAGLLFDCWLEHWVDYGFGYCAVTSRIDSDVIGLTGIRKRTDAGPGSAATCGFQSG